MRVIAEKYYDNLLALLNSIRVTSKVGNKLNFSEGIEMASRLIMPQVDSGHKLIFIGNGASAAISSHMSTDFWKNGGMMAIAPEMGPVPPHWMYYITVDDVDASVKLATELGGNILVPAMDIPVGRFAAITDPQGAAISIITLSDNG